MTNGAKRCPWSGNWRGPSASGSDARRRRACSAVASIAARHPAARTCSPTLPADVSRTGRGSNTVPGRKWRVVAVDDGLVLRCQALVPWRLEGRGDQADHARAAPVRGMARADAHSRRHAYGSTGRRGNSGPGAGRDHVAVAGSPEREAPATGRNRRRGERIQHQKDATKMAGPSARKTRSRPWRPRSPSLKAENQALREEATRPDQEIAAAVTKKRSGGDQEIAVLHEQVAARDHTARPCATTPARVGRAWPSWTPSSMR